MKKHQAYFTYQNKKILFCFWVHEDTKHPDTIIFLGTGQIKRIPYWVAKAAPSGVVVVEGLPHWHSSPNAKDLLPFSQGYVKYAFNAIFTIYGQKQMNIIGQSQAAPSVLWLANSLPHRVRNVALILPMGLNSHLLGNTEEERYQELKKRSIKSLFHPEQLGLRNIYAGLLLAKIIILGHRDGSTRKKYSKGISHTALEELKALVKKKGHKVSLFLGAHDALFPVHEIKQALNSAAITNVEIIEIPKKAHTSLTTKLSRHLVASAVKVVRK